MVKKTKKISNEQVRYRMWLCTFNNPDCTLKDLFDLFQPTYLCGQLEKGDSGTLHFQFYLHFSKQVYFTQLTKINSKIHYIGVKVNNGADSYCLKEESRVEGPFEFGVKPIHRNSRVDWDSVFINAKSGLFDNIPSDIKVRCYSNLKKIEKDNLICSDSSDVRGVWIYGPSGSGKSRLAREQYPNAYFKLANKWWDGYYGQKNVILDDFGKEHHVLGYHLKIWADRYGCILETKGGASCSSFDSFIVTSQYSIEEIWKDDKETIDALNRRFKKISLDKNLSLFNDINI